MDGKERRLYVAVFILAILLAGLSGYMISSFARSLDEGNQSSQQHTMVITGTGTVKATSTLANIKFGVVTMDSNVTEALRENFEKMNKVIEVLMTLNITEEDIETTHFGIEPGLYPWIYVGSTDKYTVRNEITVNTAQLAKIGETITAAVQAGANKVHLEFTLTSEELAELRQQARIKAVENANATANTIANALGVKIVGVASVIEQAEDYDDSYVSAVPFYIGVGFDDPPIVLRGREITVTVQVTYIIE